MERKRPARADAAPKATDQASVRESENGGIPVRKLEAALQLLLRVRADSLQSVRRKAITTTEIASEKAVEALVLEGVQNGL